MDASNDRLMRFIGSGSAFLAELDPEGVLRKGTVRSLILDIVSGGAEWKVSVAFGRDASLTLAGREAAGRLFLTSAMFRDGTDVPIPLGDGRSFCSSVGPLAALPMGLKAVLSAPTAGAGDGESGAAGLARDALSALFHGLDPSGADLSLFTGVRFLYSQERDGGVSVSSRYSVPMKGTVVVSADLDCFGISSRRVCVFKDYGMGYAGRIDCTRTWNHVTEPSLRLAFDLLGSPSAIYTKQRRKKLRK